MLTKCHSKSWLDHIEDISFENENDCILTPYSPNAKGYVYISPEGRDGPRVRLHRWYWEQKRGPIPAGKQVLHHCDNRACRNLDHLYLGTGQNNMDDKYDRDRAANQYGSHGRRL